MADSLLLLGHRGAPCRSSVVENTVESFDLALKYGGDGFEFDVRITADGRLVVCHDPQFGAQPVALANLLDLKAIATLNEILERYANRCFLNIELKVAGMEARFLAAMRQYQLLRSWVVSSFLPEVILELKARDAKIPLGIICESALQLQQAETLPAEYVMVQQDLLDENLVAKIHGSGRKIFVWTVNSASVMVRLAEWGVDGILSDDPALLVGTLRPQSGRGGSL